MRQYHTINLANQDVSTETMDGAQLVRAGRYFIAKTLNEMGAAKVDPLGPDNPLIFSAGPLAGTNFSNANRLSVGCKSPLTGGVKEANAGGNFGFALGQLEIAGFTLTGQSDSWVMIYFKKDGEIEFLDASEYMGMGNFETAEKLHERFGKKVSIGLCGLVGEYQGLMSGIAFSDVDLRPSRLAARGGVGAVMGSKKVKAVIVDLNRMPGLHDRKQVMQAVKSYKKQLEEQPAIRTFQEQGTAAVGDYTNTVGGIPVRNFSTGQATDTSGDARFKLGGDYIRELNLERGGDTTHACMPGCIIQCSNVFADKDGAEVVSPVEYETIGLMGTNCGLEEPDDLAALNWVANDLGVDTIELGAMIGVLMDAGKGKFGDRAFMEAVMEEIRQGTEDGKLYASGTKRVGEALNVARVPVIKGQAISAYDPRVIEVTGISMQMTAQGADHTAGNLPQYDSKGKPAEELVKASLDLQALCATTDSLGFCIFGRSVTLERQDFILQALKDAVDVDLPADFFPQLGRETLELENQFNRDAGFTAKDDDLPEFFYTDELAPSNQKARFRADDLKAATDNWWA